MACSSYFGPTPLWGARRILPPTGRLPSSGRPTHGHGAEAFRRRSPVRSGIETSVGPFSQGGNCHRQNVAGAANRLWKHPSLYSLCEGFKRAISQVFLRWQVKLGRLEWRRSCGQNESWRSPHPTRRRLANRFKLVYTLAGHYAPSRMDPATICPAARELSRGNVPEVCPDNLISFAQPAVAARTG